MILAIFDLQVTQMLPTKRRVKWSFGSGKEAKNRFSRWPPWRSYLGTILAIFDLQVTLMLPSKFGLNWLLGLGVEAKNRFSRWLPWRPSWIADRHDFSYFWSTSHTDASQQVWSQLALGSEEAKNRFSRWRPWRPSWISDQHDFSYFWSTSHPDAF